jgi:outer membrane protein insertion porin family
LKVGTLIHSKNIFHFIRSLKFTNLKTSRIIGLLLLILSLPVLGQNLQVKRIIIAGNYHTKGYIIRRELLTKVGESLSEEKLREDELRLRNLGIFSDVWIYHLPEEGGEVVHILVKERFLFIPFPLLNYSEFDRWSYGGGIFYKNFLGRNQTVGVFGLFGGVTEYFFTLYDPWIANHRISLQCEFARLERDHRYENFHQIERYIWCEIGKRWEYVKWSRIKFGFRQVDSDISGITLTSDRFDRIPFVQFTGIYDTRNLWSNPSKGWRIIHKLGQFGVPSQKPDFRLLEITIARFFPLSWGRTWGVMLSFSEKNGLLPCYERLYFGGPYTVRGLKWNTNRGNRILLTGWEYHFDLIKSRPILPKLDFGFGGTVFWDGGTVWTGEVSWNKLRFYQGFGVGSRFFVPFVEVLRVDLC